MTEPPIVANAARESEPKPRATRARAWLVALLGFGAADLLILNLWAVPKLVIPSIPSTTATTTDVRAAERAEHEPAAASQRKAAGASEAVRASRPAQGEGRAPGDTGQSLTVAAPEPRAEPAAPAAKNMAIEASEVAQAQRHVEPAAAEEEADDDNVDIEDPSAAARENQPTQARADAPAPQPPPGSDDEAELAERHASGAQDAPEPAALTTNTGTNTNVPTLEAPSDDARPEGLPLTQVYFSLGNFAIGPRGKDKLERALPQLLADESPVVVIGSADPTGPEHINETLSDARAQAVSDWLVEHGVAEARVDARGIGNTGAGGTALDRRVDIWLGGSR